MKLIYTFFVFSFFSITSNAQHSLNNQSNDYLSKQVHSIFKTINTIKGQNEVSFCELEQMANKITLDSMDRKKYTKTSFNRVPSVVYGLGGLVLYFAGQKLLYGSLDNANLLAPILTTVSGIVIGEIINASSRGKVKTARRY